MGRKKKFDEREVLEKILALFRAKGFYQASLQEILAAGGIGKQSMYDTFGDKRELFVKALKLYNETSFQEMGSFVSSETAMGKPSSEILKTMLHPKEALDGEIKCCLMANSMIEFRGQDDGISEEINNFLSFLRSQIEAVVSYGQSRNEITSKLEARQIADILLNARNGVQVGQDFNISSEALANTADWTIELICCN